MPTSIERSIDIGASPETVWSVLEDHASYPEWNPFMVRMAGDWRVGARLEVVLQPVGGKAMTFRPEVEVAEPAAKLQWLGHLWVSGLFDGRHELILEPIDETHTRFVQRESFTGILVPFLGGTLDGARQGFEAMNRALKERAEAR